MAFVPVVFIVSMVSSILWGIEVIEESQTLAMNFFSFAGLVLVLYIIYIVRWSKCEL